MRKAKAPADDSTRVEISADSVVIEAAAGLDAVTAKALALWRDTHPAQVETATTAVGFAIVSDPVSSPLLPPEAVLPHRLQPDVETE